MSQKEAVEVAKIQKLEQDDIVEAYGVRARLVSVPVGVVQDALAHINVPEVPTWYNEDKGREEDNPSDPSYLAAVDRYNEKRGMVSTDTFCMFGLELLDELPKDETWLKRLRIMHRRGTLDLSWCDFDDETDKEFLFKRYVLGALDVITRIGQKTGVTKEAIAQAKAGFQRNT